MLSYGLIAQNFTTGLLPNITLSYKISEVYNIVHKVVSRFPTYSDVDKTTDVQFERLDIQNYLVRKIGLSSKISLGYMYRVRDANVDAHRLVQQLAWTDFFTSFRIGHRVRTDQTLSRTLKPEMRYRYRATIQVPLQGKQIDNKEYYLSISNELLYAYRSPNQDMENRVVGKIGFYINDKNKIECGLDWRADQILLKKVNHLIWASFNWYKTL